MEPRATGQPQASPAGRAISPPVSSLVPQKPQEQPRTGHCACSERPLPPAASPPRLLCRRRGSGVQRRTVPSFPEPLGGSGLTEDLAAGRKPPQARFSAGRNSHFPRDTPRPGTRPIPVSICLPRHRYGAFFLEPEVT